MSESQLIKASIEKSEEKFLLELQKVQDEEKRAYLVRQVWRRADWGPNTSGPSFWHIQYLLFKTQDPAFITAELRLLLPLEYVLESKAMSHIMASLLLRTLDVIIYREGVSVKTTKFLLKLYFVMMTNSTLFPELNNHKMSTFLLNGVFGSLSKPKEGANGPKTTSFDSLITQIAGLVKERRMKEVSLFSRMFPGFFAENLNEILDKVPLNGLNPQDFSLIFPPTIVKQGQDDTCSFLQPFENENQFKEFSASILTVYGPLQEKLEKGKSSPGFKNFTSAVGQLRNKWWWSNEEGLGLVGTETLHHFSQKIFSKTVMKAERAWGFFDFLSFLEEWGSLFVLVDFLKQFEEESERYQITSIQLSTAYHLIFEQGINSLNFNELKEHMTYEKLQMNPSFLLQMIFEIVFKAIMEQRGTLARIRPESLLNYLKELMQMDERSIADELSEFLEGFAVDALNFSLFIHSALNFNAPIGLFKESEIFRLLFSKLSHLRHQNKHALLSELLSLEERLTDSSSDLLEALYLLKNFSLAGEDLYSTLKSQKQTKQLLYRVCLHNSQKRRQDSVVVVDQSPCSLSKPVDFLVLLSRLGELLERLSGLIRSESEEELKLDQKELCFILFEALLDESNTAILSEFITKVCSGSFFDSWEVRLMEAVSRKASYYIEMGMDFYKKKGEIVRIFEGLNKINELSQSRAYNGLKKGFNCIYFVDQELPLDISDFTQAKKHRFTPKEVLDPNPIEFLGKVAQIDKGNSDIEYTEIYSQLLTYNLHYVKKLDKEVDIYQEDSRFFVFLKDLALFSLSKSDFDKFYSIVNLLYEKCPRFVTSLVLTALEHFGDEIGSLKISSFVFLKGRVSSSSSGASNEKVKIMLELALDCCEDPLEFTKLSKHLKAFSGFGEQDNSGFFSINSFDILLPPIRKLKTHDIKSKVKTLIYEIFVEMQKEELPEEIVVLFRQFLEALVLDQRKACFQFAMNFQRLFSSPSLLRQVFEIAVKQVVSKEVYNPSDFGISLAIVLGILSFRIKPSKFDFPSTPSSLLSLLSSGTPSFYSSYIEHFLPQFYILSNHSVISRLFSTRELLMGLFGTSQERMALFSSALTRIEPTNSVYGIIQRVIEFEGSDVSRVEKDQIKTALYSNQEPREIASFFKMKIKGGTYSKEECLFGLRETVWEEKGDWEVGIKFVEVFELLEDSPEVKSTLKLTMPYLKLLGSLFTKKTREIVKKMQAESQLQALESGKDQRPEGEDLKGAKLDENIQNHSAFCIFDVLPSDFSGELSQKEASLKQIIQSLVTTKTVMILAKTVPFLLEKANKTKESMQKEEIFWMLVLKFLQKKESLVFFADFLPCLSEESISQLIDVLLTRTKQSPLDSTQETKWKEGDPRISDKTGPGCHLNREEAAEVLSKIEEVLRQKEKEGIWDGLNFTRLIKKLQSFERNA